MISLTRGILKDTNELIYKTETGNSLAVQWLGLSAFIARLGFDPWSGN